MTAGLLDFDGCGDGDRSLAQWTLDDPAVAATAAGSFPGGYGILIGTNGVSTRGWAERTFAADVTQPRIGFHLTVSQISGDGAAITFKKDGTVHVTVEVRPDGAIRVKGPTDTVLGSTAAGTIDYGVVWHWEVELTSHDTTGTVDVYLDGDPTPVLSVTGDTKAAGASAVFNQVRFANGRTQELSVDDLTVLEMNGTGASSLGIVRVRGFAPDGDVTTDWTASAGGSQYALVDDQPFSATDYLYSDTPTEIARFSCSDGGTTEPVLGARVIGHLALRDGAGAQSRLFLADGANVSNGATRTLGAAAVYADVFADPPGGGAWAGSGTLEFGAEVVTGSGSNSQLNAVAVEVLYARAIGTTRATMLESSFAGSGIPGAARVTSFEANYAGAGEPGTARVSHLYVYALVRSCIPTTGRIITTPLNDTTLRPQYIGHKAIIERTDDPYTTTEDLATWEIDASGFVTRATLVDALTWEFAVGDTNRVERDTALFAGPEVVAGQPSCLIAGPVTGGFGDVIDAGMPLYEVTSVEAGEFLTLGYRTGPYTPRAHINAVAAQFVSRVSDYESFGRGYVFPTIVVELYDPATGVLVASGAGSIRGVTGEFTPISLRSNVRPRGYRVGPGGVLMPGRLNERLISDSDAFTIDWATAQPAVGTRYRVRMYASQATETTPFHFDGHPVDIATDIYDALGVEYDATTATLTKEALGPDLRFLLRPTAPAKAIEVLEDWLYGPAGFAYRVVDGVREFYATRLRDGTAPATTITKDDLRGEGTPYDVSDRGILSRITWEEQQFNFWELEQDRAEDVTAETLAGLAIDGLESSPATTVFLQDDDNAPPNQGEQTYTLPGFIVEPLAGQVGSEATFKGQTAAELFYRWGRGTVEVAFPMLPSFTEQIGDYIINEVDYSPIPEADALPITVRPKDYPARTPRQILQLVKRSESVAGPDCTFLVVGPVAGDVETAVGALTVPTLSIAANAEYPKNGTRITVTNWGTIAPNTNNRVDLQYNTGAISPTTWNSAGTLMPASIATGSTATPLVAAGSKVWARGRTWNLDGRISSWSTPVSVTLTALTPPSGLAGAVTGTTSEVTFTWTNGEATEPVVLRYEEAGVSGWVEMATLTAGTTRYVYVFPDASTQYDVEVFHRQVTPANSVSTADSTTVTTGASTPTLDAPTVPQATTADGSVTLCVTVGDVQATGTVFQLAGEQADGSFSGWEPYAVLPPGGDRLCARTTVPLQTSPFVGTRARYWQVRAYHTALGYTDSATTTAITVDPWAISTPPPPIEGGTYSEGDLLVADAAGAMAPLAIGGTGEILASDGTTATWQPTTVRQSYVGYNTVGGSWETVTARRVYAKKITLTEAGLLASIQAYVQNDPGAADDQVESLSVALYTDNSGTPNNVIAVSQNPEASLLLDDTSGAGGDGVGRWLGVPLGYWLTAGDYWIAVACLEASVTALQIAYDGSGSDRYYTSSGSWFSDWGADTPSTSSNKYSVRAVVIT